VHPRTRRLIAGACALALLAGSGAAYAANGKPKAGRAPAPGAFIGAITTYLGLTPQQLRADLTSGQTLAQIVAAQGKTVTGLEQAVEAAAKTKLDALVSAGTITSAQEQAILAKLQTGLDTLVNSAHTRTPGRSGMPRAGGAILSAAIQAAATALGVTPAQLESDVKAGQTLAQIAAANGTSITTLEQSIESAVKTQLDKAVGAGRLSSTQEQQLLTELASKLDTLVNHSFGK
jgi:hypothetical protein